MSQLEALREKLHSMLETGNTNDILALSRELDKLIIFNMKSQQRPQKSNKQATQEKYRKADSELSRTNPGFSGSASHTILLDCID